ncbi:hypothetical protein I2I05_05120 [Hymenobacter sp. BT683]|uniref:Uncharacterized protein n=1 Tax=Hymenobacter jeongseonensis TaxID=2791027 RepID=A0ABS0IEI8_9BACT|nr:hypothetical protein [Hymenobacter jeongseonensis]MBF9236769.1 hypothetical protein [Hymenobacter jeongseonensis]
MPSSQHKLLNTNTLSYEQFQATTNRYATWLALRAKNTYPYANDPGFAKDFMLRGFSLLINEPQDGIGKAVIDRFDVSYKLGLSLRATLIHLLTEVISEKRKNEAHFPKVTHKIVVKRWGKVPLPWISHRERYEDGILESRIYRRNVESVKVHRFPGLYEGALVSEPSMRNLWHFLISVYAARKLNTMYENYQSGNRPLALYHATPEEIAKEVEDTNPVGSNNKPLKKMQWQGPQNRLAELFIVLEEKNWITAPVAGAIQRAFNPAVSIADYLKPNKTEKSNKRHYSRVYTAEYTGIFDCIPDNLEKV